MPEHGVNYAGEWRPGKKGADGNEIPVAHKNARYTVQMSALKNLDPLANDPEGVPVGGIIYGGRDSDTWVPVQQSFDWRHGVVTMGASVVQSGSVDLLSSTLGAFALRTYVKGTGISTSASGYDNLSYTPEPATLAVLGLGGLAALIRRRR